MFEIFVFLTILFGGMLAVVSYLLFKTNRVLNQAVAERTDAKLKLRKRNDQIVKLKSRIDMLQEELENTCAYADSERAHYEEKQLDLIGSRNIALAQLERVLEERSFLPNYQPHRLMVA
jgi:hypothetical protein